MTRYVPSRHYLHAGLAAVLCGLFSVWCGWRWAPAYVAAGLLLATAALLLYLAARPAIEIGETRLSIGRRNIAWTAIRRLDRTGWLSPLAVSLTLADDSRVLLIYPGDADSANRLLRHLRRHAREALIDGIPYRQFWGEPLPAKDRALASPRYRLLRPEDEAEVERLYQRLRTVRHLDPDSSSDKE
ncbi:MAG: hypothetical protein ABSD56_02735 [Bryobacteraceae bacterium]